MAPSPQQATPSPSPSTLPTPHVGSIQLTKTSIIWLSLISALVVIGFSATIYLLCTCCVSRKKRQASRQVLDDRNMFPAWNPRAATVTPYGSAEGSESVELTPLTRAAVRPGGHRESNVGMHPGEPVVVDEAEEPVFGEQRVRKSTEMQRQTAQAKNSRYYSGWRDSAWKRLSRFSQIGRAY